MPTVDTPYIIGVIREREKLLLKAADYTRIAEAPDSATAFHVLLETPYRAWIEPDASPEHALAALDGQLNAVRQWLGEVVADQRVLAFIGVRYDALNIATALLDWGEERPEPGPLSPLGFIAVSVIHSTIWNEVGFEYMPAPWAAYLRQERAQLQATDGRAPGWRTALLTRAEQHAATTLASLATTPLMRAVAAMYHDRLFLDALVRPGRTPITSPPGLRPDGAGPTPLGAEPLDTTTPVPALVAALERAGYRSFTAPQLEAVRALTDARAYEKAWDEELLHRLQAHRYEPVGYDPILAFWLALELEVKTLRLVLSAKLNRLPAAAIVQLQRPAYLTRL